MARRAVEGCRNESRNIGLLDTYCRLVDWVDTTRVVDETRSVQQLASHVDCDPSMLISTTSLPSRCDDGRDDARVIRRPWDRQVRDGDLSSASAEKREPQSACDVRVPAARSTTTSTTICSNRRPHTIDMIGNRRRRVSLLLLMTLGALVASGAAASDENCRDGDTNCIDWVAADSAACFRSGYVREACDRTCGFCRYVPQKFDLSRLPANLQSAGFLVGIWRSEHGGKAIFPTIPKFTYGEQLEFSIPDSHMTATPALNYTAFAWTVNQGDEELHSETGFIAIRPDSRWASLTSVMSNGFATVEEGNFAHNRISFRLLNIGRISFSRDMPVNDLIREWTLIDSRTLDSRLEMETIDHGMREHTRITYKKIFP